MKIQQKQPISLPKYGLLFLVIGIIVCTNARAQTPANTGDNKVYTGVEKNPQPVGGFSEFYQFIEKNIRYPKEMHDKNVQGNVIAQFIVETDGSLSNIKAIRGPGYGSEEETVRVLGLSPKWMPGEQGGKAVRVQFTIPVKFSLSTPIGQQDKKTGEIDIKKLINTKSPLYVIDGKVAEKETFDKFDRNTIAGISILKNASVATYGEKGAIYGVILITTKDNTKATN